MQLIAVSDAVSAPGSCRAACFHPDMRDGGKLGKLLWCCSESYTLKHASRLLID